MLASYGIISEFDDTQVHDAGFLDPYALRL